MTTHTRDVEVPRQQKSPRVKHRMFRSLLSAVALIVPEHGTAMPAALAAFPALASVHAKAVYSNLPLYFEANQGQTDGQVQFLSRGKGYTLFLTPTEAVFALRQRGRNGEPENRGTGEIKNQKSKIKSQKSASEHQPSAPSPQSLVLRMQLVGANPTPQVTGMEELSSNANYFVGKDSTKWRTNIPTYGKVKYEAVYPGVDLVYHGNQQQLEYDFIVAPGTDPHRIRLEFIGADSVVVDAQGDLVLHTAVGQIRQPKPYIYQEDNGAKKEVPGTYVFCQSLTPSTQHPAPGASPPTRTVGFQIGAYDATKPLVIDPEIWYSTFLGGGSSDLGNDVAVDSDGATYVVGTTHSLDFPTQNPLPQVGAPSDIFITKFSATNSPNVTPILVYSTYLGGGGLDEGNGIAVDGNKNVYITGLTSSFDFPTTDNAFQQNHAGGVAAEFPTDAFVVKINAAGSQIRYATYLGGGGEDSANGIALDSDRNAYVTGQTISDDFPFRSPALAPGEKPFQGEQGGAVDAFIVKLNPSASGNVSLVYSAYIGGSGFDSGNAIAVHSDGDAYITGQTDSPNFPTKNPIHGDKPGTDAFMARFDHDGSHLDYATYLGGSGTDKGFGIVVDPFGMAYLTGVTGSFDFPLLRGQDTTNQINEAFVTKLNTGGSGGQNLIYSTFVGGSGTETGLDIALDLVNTAWVTGITGSLNIPGFFPLRRPTPQPGNGNDAFVAQILPPLVPPPGGPQFPPQPAKVGFGMFLGSGGDQQGNGIAVDNADRVYIVGSTDSSGLPVTNAIQPNFGGFEDAFVVKLGNLGAGLSGAWSQPIQKCAGEGERARCDIQAALTVLNPGTESTVRSALLLFLSADEILDEGDRLVKESKVGRLESGQREVQRLQFRLPTGQNGAGQFLIAVLDAENDVPEANEENNNVVSPPIP